MISGSLGDVCMRELPYLQNYSFIYLHECKYTPFGMGSATPGRAVLVKNKVRVCIVINKVTCVYCA